MWRFLRRISERNSECASNFVPVLGKVLRRPSQWFNKPSGTKAWVVRVCFNGMSGSRPVARQLTMTNTQGNPQAAQLLKLLNEFKSSSVRIDVGPFTTLLRRWELVMVHTNGFWRKKWACTLSQPNLCPGSWQVTRSSSASTSAPNWTELKDKMAVIPHPPYSPDLAPCDFFLFPKNEIEAVWTPVWYHWGDTGQIAECLTLWYKRTSRKRSKNVGDGGTGVCMREETTSRVTAADRFYDFYGTSPENFGYHLVSLIFSICLTVSSLSNKCWENRKLFLLLLLLFLRDSY